MHTGFEDLLTRSQSFAPMEMVGKAVEEVGIIRNFCVEVNRRLGEVSNEMHQREQVHEGRTQEIQQRLQAQESRQTNLAESLERRSRRFWFISKRSS